MAQWHKPSSAPFDKWGSPPLFKRGVRGDYHLCLYGLILVKNTVTIRRLNIQDTDFSAKLNTLLAWESVNDHQLQQTVSDILARVKQQGDSAVLDYTRRFDQVTASNFKTLTILPEQLLAAYEGLGDEQREALSVAAERVRYYHQKQIQ